MNDEDRSFTKRQKNLLSSIGFGAREVDISSHATKEQLIKKIEEFNTDKDIDGIILCMPLQEHLRTYQDDILSSIDSLKDVDNFSRHNYYKMINEPKNQKIDILDLN